VPGNGNRELDAVLPASFRGRFLALSPLIVISTGAVRKDRGAEISFRDGARKKHRAEKISPLCAFGASVEMTVEG